MNIPARFSPDDSGRSLPRKDDYGDEVHDEDIVYEPLEDAAWVDEEDLNAIEVTEEDAAPVVAPAEPPVPESPAADAETPLGEHSAPARQPEIALPAASAPAAPCLYRIVVPLTDELRAEVATARGDHALEGDDPGALALIAPFRSDDPGALEDALRAWAAERLPLDVTLNEVAAEVIGARRYVAGWALAPAGRITAAQQALARALSDLSEPCDEPPDAFEPRIVVADAVPPPVFPHLIADLQRDFEPRAWTITRVVLEEAPPGGQAPRWTPRLTVP